MSNHFVISKNAYLKATRLNIFEKFALLGRWNFQIQQNNILIRSTFDFTSCFSNERFKIDFRHIDKTFNQFKLEKNRTLSKFLYEILFFIYFNLNLLLLKFISFTMNSSRNEKIVEQQSRRPYTMSNS
jgi:hypothetical protein